MPAIFDKNKKEYVVKAGRTLLSNNLVYETSPDAGRAFVVQENKAELSNLEKILKYPEGTLVYEEATRDALLNSDINHISDMIARIFERYDSKEDAKKIIQQIVKSLEYNAGIDTEPWLYDLDDNLNEAFDD